MMKSGKYIVSVTRYVPQTESKEFSSFDEAKEYFAKVEEENAGFFDQAKFDEAMQYNMENGLAACGEEAVVYRQFAPEDDARFDSWAIVWREK